MSEKPFTSNLAHELPSPHIHEASSVTTGEQIRPWVESTNRGLANPGVTQAEDLMYQHAVEQGKTNQELQKLAVTDELTGLLNRRGILAKLDAVVSDKNFDSGRYILIYMDLNGFKPINDNHGHDAGDKVLKGIAGRFNRRKSDVAGRIGGDEFVILVDTWDAGPDRRGEGRVDPSPRRLPRTHEEIIAGLTQHLSQEVIEGGIDAGYAGISASVGVQKFNGETNPESIINKAEMAMQAHKVITKAGR